MTKPDHTTWTETQLAWAAWSQADGRHSDAWLALSRAEREMEFEELRDGEDDAPSEALGQARRQVETCRAEVDASQVAAESAKRAYMATVRLTRTQAANRVGVSPDTFSAYVSRGYAPQPNSHDKTGHPWWYELTIEDWIRTRPGRGARTDRRSE